ncbi:hypothetical protein FJ208_00950 [Candidatus Gribaldobacteria bacterium]|nr:hypothetical protein [Candidatus Gribaldobacteria bacterium]
MFQEGQVEKRSSNWEEKTLEDLFSIENHSKISREDKDEQENNLFKILSDKQVFDLLFFIKEAHSKAQKVKDEEKLEKLWVLYKVGNFIFGEREASAYNQIGDLAENATEEELGLLPSEILEQLNKIKQVGEEFVSGPSRFWGLNGPKIKTPIQWPNLVFVRRTNLPPIIDGSPALFKPQFFIPSPLHLKTLHWTFNSPVSPHTYGSWAESTCTIFAPAQETVRKNGPPLVLNETNSFWYNKNLNLPKNSIILQEKNKRKDFSIVNAIKTRPDFLEKNKLENLLNELRNDYCLINVEFIDLRSWLLLHRAIIKKMGYSYFNCGWWPDPRITELTQPLREEYGIYPSLSVEDESNIQRLDKMKSHQDDILKQKGFPRKIKEN